jgi:metal-dependent HD superfamily phosphatase/phosphodiesterase
VIDRRELEAFEASVLADDEVRRMLEDITHSVAVQAQQQSPTRIDVTMGLWLIGLAGLWQLAKVGIHHLRGLSDTAVLQKQVEVIAEVKTLGYDEKQAAQVVERLLKLIRTRPDDDTVLKALQKMRAS